MVLTAKVAEGAWVTLPLIPAMLTAMIWVRHHYEKVGAEIATEDGADFEHLDNPIVVAPICGWNKVTRKALRFAYTLSHEVRAVHISVEEESEDKFCHWHLRLDARPVLARSCVFWNIGYWLIATPLKPAMPAGPEVALSEISPYGSIA